jgi:hypothetical protein
MNEQWIYDVLLDDASVLSVNGGLFHQPLDISVLLGYLDALAAIRAFTRLYYPYVLSFDFTRCCFLFSRFLSQIVCPESLELWIIYSGLHMKCDRQVIKRILIK